MTKIYVHGDEFATVRENGRLIQVNERAIRNMVWEGAKDLPVDEIKWGDGFTFGFDEDGCYIKW